MKKYIFFLLFSLILNQKTADSVNQNYKLFLKPIVCSSYGISNYLTSTYNHKEYPSFLGMCFLHIVDLIQYAHKESVDIRLSEQIFLLFSQKIKETRAVNLYSLIFLLESIHPLIKDMIHLTHLVLEKEIEDILKKEFIENIEMFKKNPEEFIKNTSYLISNNTQKNNESNFDFLRSIESFIEGAFEKIMFNTQEEFFDVFEKTLEILSLYQKDNIFNVTFINRLQWLLIIRLSHCISLNKEDLNESDIERIKKNLNAISNSKFLYPKELEYSVLTKKEYITAIFK